jgi:sulfite reductase subunit B
MVILTVSKVSEQNNHIYLPITCKVESIRGLTETEKLFKLIRKDGLSFGHKPGQFVQVSIAGIGEAPISVSSSPTRGNYLELGVRKAGTLTQAMHKLKRGDEISTRGPFGTCFNTEMMKGKDLLLISGGCGLAPMRALIQYVEDCRNHFGEVTILYGAKSPQDVLYQDEIFNWQHSAQLECQLTVDNVIEGTCWDANVGLVTELIKPLKINESKTIAVVVGPPVMYKHVIKELLRKNIRDKNIIVSLERYMKCGIGKCGHCSIEHFYCCLDGPVFTLDQVAHINGAI